MNEIKRIKAFRGYKGDGTLVITDECIYWNKSGISYLKFGLLNAITTTHIHCSYDNVSKIVFKKGLGRDGIIIVTLKDEEFDFFFKRKPEAKEIYDCLLSLT